LFPLSHDSYHPITITIKNNTITAWTISQYRTLLLSRLLRIILDKESKSGTRLAMPQLLGLFRVARAAARGLLRCRFLFLLALNVLALLLFIFTRSATAHDDGLICHGDDDDALRCCTIFYCDVSVFSFPL
jgi:hypothetical protein